MLPLSCPCILATVVFIASMSACVISVPIELNISVCSIGTFGCVASAYSFKAWEKSYTFKPTCLFMVSFTS